MSFFKSLWKSLVPGSKENLAAIGGGLGFVAGGPAGAAYGAATGYSIGNSRDQSKQNKADVSGIESLTKEYEALYQTALTKTKSQQAKASKGYINALRARSGGRGFLGDSTLG
jgi:hypothetical protein